MKRLLLVSLGLFVVLGVDVGFAMLTGFIAHAAILETIYMAWGVWYLSKEKKA